jgi:hypothetical protein
MEGGERRERFKILDKSRGKVEAGVVQQTHPYALQEAFVKINTKTKKQNRVHTKCLYNINN